MSSKIVDARLAEKVKALRDEGKTGANCGGVEDCSIHGERHSAAGRPWRPSLQRKEASAIA
jgi:hypothetical protein